MGERLSSRLLVIDPLQRVLLFRFEHEQGALAGQRFWATPGGALDPGETYAQAACRELLEETGLMVDDPGPEVGQRTATFQMPDGEMVRADERFFLVRADALDISSATELLSTAEQVWPEDLTDLQVRLEVWKAAD
jgi:8-oxo-dGTP pyrophosphatase MutT (NUDIX family)